MTTTGHGNQRGNSDDRRRRRQWLLDKYGNGRVARCWECNARVDMQTMIVDRIVPGKHGGTYRRNNIRPQCWVCSNKQGYRLGVGNGSVSRLGNGTNADTRTVSRMENPLMKYVRRFITAIGFLIAFAILTIAIHHLPAWQFILAIVAGLGLSVVKEVRATNRS